MHMHMHMHMCMCMCMPVWIGISSERLGLFTGWAYLLEAPRRGHARLTALPDRLLPILPQLADRAERALVQPEEIRFLDKPVP